MADQGEPPPAGQKATKTPTVQDGLAQLEALVSANQKSVTRNMSVLNENAIKAQQSSDAQFARINAALVSIAASLKAAQQQPAIPPPAITPTVTQAAGTSASSDTNNGAATNAGVLTGPTASIATEEDFPGFLPPSGSSAGSVNGSHVARQASRKLHSLPVFSGAPEEWPKFIMRYRQTTEAYDYSAIDNSLRLQECLKGEALNAVDAKLNDASQTDAVIAELEKRFGRPELLAQVQLRVVRDILPMPETRPELIVPFSSKISNMLACIDQPATRQYLFNPELLEQLIQKLPLSRRHEWGKCAIKIVPYPTIRDFNTWLMQQADEVAMMTPAATLAAATLPTHSTNVARRPAATQPQNNQRRDRMMHVSTTAVQSCGACDATNHDATHCNQFERKNLQERWELVRDKRMCFGCLQRGHGLQQCESRAACGIDNCTRPHHQLLHSATTRRNQFDRQPPRNELPPLPQHRRPARANPPQADAAASTSTAERERVNNCHAAAPAAHIMFRIIPVQLFGNDKTVKTFAFLDEGSSVTLMDDMLATELGLTGPRTSLDLQWFGGRCATEVSRTVALRISGIGHGHQAFDMPHVRTVRHLDLPTQSIAMGDLARRYECLRGLPVADYDRAVPKLLIGLDNVHLGVATRQVSCAAPGPVATRTKLGWILCGPMQAVNRATVLHAHSLTAKLENIDRAVTDYFSLENFGVRHADSVLEPRDHIRARKIMADTTTRVKDRFEIGLLWRHDQAIFPESRDMAVKRLLSVERRMKRDRSYADEYSAIMAGYVSKGYARLLTAEEAADAGERTWYLPHFAVSNPNKPGKMRIVFDAAAVANGMSLNDQLIKGPDLNRSLLGVLHKFRMGMFGVCADIREMFSQIRIRAEDVHSQRFLWRDGDESQQMRVYVMQSMVFGAACSPCCAQFVKNANADVFANKYPAAVEMIHNAHYVDDFVGSFDTACEAAAVSKQIVHIHKQAGFELRGFLSNSAEVLREIDEKATETPKVLDMQLDDSADKVLGMYWCTQTDEFLFRLAFSRVDADVVSGQRRPSKREVLSAVMSIYDPFGLLANFTIHAKLLLQDVWREGTAWDEPIPNDIDAKWKQWLAKLGVCRQVRVPRCYGPQIARLPVQLHMFADASQSAFATVAYWRVQIAPAEWRVVFVAGKSRCAPQKLHSIPRLELQAAILAVRLQCSIRELHDMPIERTYYWTDSKTVVQWVRSDRLQFRPFVAHRIAEILEATAIADWHWVPTAQNAADDATRAKYPIRYEATNRWIGGPDFLTKDESQWPQEEPAQMSCDIGTEEVKPLSVQMVCVKTPLAVVQITRFSNFYRACRSMAYVLRHVRNQRPSTRRSGELQPGEIEDAERKLIMAAQHEAYGAELAALQRGEAVDKSSTIRMLLPHIDQHGILRVTGRIDKAVHLPEDCRNPTILPRDHHLTTLVVQMIHSRLRHQQQAAVVCEVRSKFWISHLPVLVRRVKSNCMLCRLKSARAAEQIMGQLPTDRLTPFVRPFTYTGVDYFGPMSVAIGRRREKRWVALFTCMTVRAVHLELASDLSTDAFMLCLRNFINIRGCPKRMRSDNGTNFVGANRELKEAVDALDHESIQRELGTRNIEWRFNCPSNPEAGGCWERLVQSIKRVLAVTVKDVAPQVETLRSLLIEAANIVNSRPLTHLPVHHDEDEPLTPNHLLLGTSSSTQTPGPVDDRPICMRKQWRIAQALKNHFWKRWLLEYLPDLTRRTKGHVDRPNLTVGALVLIVDSQIPRAQWRRGRVTAVCTAPDGRVRTATIKTSDGELRRPVARLAVLDVLE